jgi:hypothetical protein
VPISDLRFQVSRGAPLFQAQSEIGNLQSAMRYRQLRSLEAT